MGTNNSPRGRMIAIEGVDAVGKQTQTALLVSWIRRRGESVATLSFPDYSTPIGKEIEAFLAGRRSYPINLQHILFAANRWEKKNELEAHLRKDKILIVDRYTQSNLVYGVANGLEEGWLANLERGLPKADLVVVLDAPPRKLTSRRPDRAKDTYEIDAKFQEKVARLYRKLASKHQWRLIKADRSIDEVHKEMVQTVEEALFGDDDA